LGHTSKGIFEGYDKRDPNNPDAVRSFAERDKHLLTNMQGWYDSAKSNDLTKDDNPHNDGLFSRIGAFLQNPNGYDRVQIAALLREAGAGDYADAYTSDRWDLSKSSD
jgi:hypothetical protein